MSAYRDMILRNVVQGGLRPIDTRPPCPLCEERPIASRENGGRGKLCYSCQDNEAKADAEVAYERMDRDEMRGARMRR